MDIIYISGLLSLIIQIFTAGIGVYVVTLDYDPSLFIIRDLLFIELFVQLVEGSFYVWLVYNLGKHPNITPIRYYDWMVTTPTMLMSYSLYLVYLRNKEDISRGKNKPTVYSFYNLVKYNLPILVPIFILNTLMLMFGYLAEIGKVSYNIGAVLGFIPFFAMFYIIYENYAKFTHIGKTTFWVFSATWGLYGVASVLSYKWKNVFYNVLDLFSKNLFGIFLAYVLYSNNSS